MRKPIALGRWEEPCKSVAINLGSRCTSVWLLMIPRLCYTQSTIIPKDFLLTILFGQEVWILLPKIICSLLLDELYNVANSVCRIVAYKKMYMVFIGFLSYNTVTFGVTDIVYLLFNIVSNRTFKYLFTILCHKDYMYF